jgi:hypothetical protein
LEIEVARIKLAAEPVEHFLVFFVLGILDGLPKGIKREVPFHLS